MSEDRGIQREIERRTGIADAREELSPEVLKLLRLCGGDVRAEDLQGDVAAAAPPGAERRRDDRRQDDRRHIDRRLVERRQEARRIAAT